ncbi:DUF6944 family repetitive protein [Nocardia sp. 004]|uniref:DUF6944 family repetitive protein n=1 Tax=Nocardia sp. 004 TaxID=3385978 RepID=UPI0039A3849A
MTNLEALVASHVGELHELDNYAAAIDEHFKVVYADLHEVKAGLGRVEVEQSECRKLLESQGETLESHGKLLESQGKTLESHGKLLESQGKTLETHGKLLESQGKTLETHGKLLESQGKTLESQGKTLETHGKLLEAILAKLDR